MAPLNGVCFAGTGINNDELDRVAAAVKGLGGDFIANLGDKTLHFLVVGKRWSEKYNYCAQNLSRTAFLRAQTLLDLHDRYVSGETIDVKQHLTNNQLEVFEGLKVTASSLDSKREKDVTDAVTRGGGNFTRTLNRECDLVVAEQCGGKRAKFAEQWGKPVVIPQWIDDSLSRGVALPTDPYLTRHQADRPAPVPLSLANSLVAGESMNSVAQDNEIESFDFKAGPKRKAPDQYSDLFVPKSARLQPTTTVNAPNSIQSQTLETPSSSGIFSGLTFTLNGFNQRETEILRKTITSHDGTFESPYDYLVVNSKAPEIPTDRLITSRTRVITEWAIERSLYKNAATLQDVWGEPLYQQSLEGFKGIKVCLSGYQNIELVHLERLVNALGADLKPSLTVDRDILVASSTKCQKFKFAKAWKIPVVTEGWLWECAKQGRVVDISERHALDGLGSRAPPLAVQVAAHCSNTSLANESGISSDKGNDSGSFVEYGSDDEENGIPTPVGKDFTSKSVPKRRSKRILDIA